MFDQAGNKETTICNARLVLPDGVRTGSLTFAGSLITDIGTSQSGIDIDGDYLIPGVVDLHTDHLETHVFPRSGVQWSFHDAIAAYDGVIISGGTTTVFDSLSVGATMRRPERREILEPIVNALEESMATGALRAEHFLHMRCEICDPTTIPLVDAVMPKDIARLVSVMDHTPGDRQSPDVERWVRAMSRDMQIDLVEGRRLLEELLERSAREGPVVRAHVVSSAKAADLPLMSHDDRTLDHIAQSRGEGIDVAEFPVTLEAAQEARAVGQAIVAGAPNFVRGGSQSGNVAVRDLLKADVVDALASDYVPRSPLDAAFAIADDDELGIPLERAVDMISAAPARIAGLADRGRLEEGLRADCVRVRRQSGRNLVMGVWREGRRVY